MLGLSRSPAIQASTHQRGRFRTGGKTVGNQPRSRGILPHYPGCETASGKFWRTLMRACQLEGAAQAEG
jgi:hypothetical protein